MKKPLFAAIQGFFCLLLVCACVAPHPDGRTPQLDRAIALLDGYDGDLGTLETARADLDTVIAADPGNARAHREMSRYLMLAGHTNSERYLPGSLEAARAELDKAIALNPDDADAYVLSGRLYRLMNRRDAAAAALTKAETLGTANPWLHLNWADLLADAGRLDEAAGRYRQVIDARTGDKRATIRSYEGLVRYYISHGDLDRADETYRTQIDYDPRAAWSYGNYAMFLLCMRDDYDASIPRARQALEILDYGMGRYTLASGLYRKWAQHVLSGEPDAGAPAFREAREVFGEPQKVIAYGQGCAPLRYVARALAIDSGPPAIVVAPGVTNEERP